MKLNIPSEIEKINLSYFEEMESLTDVEEAIDYDFTIMVEPEDLKKKLCGFANSGGGYYFIGLDHDRSKLRVEIKGCSKEYINADWIYNVSKGVEPKIKIYVNPVTIKNKRIIVIKIYQSDMMPHQYDGKYYIRIGSLNAAMPESLVEKLYLVRQEKEKEFDNIVKELNYGLSTKATNNPEFGIIIHTVNKVNGLIKEMPVTREKIKNVLEELKNKNILFYDKFHTTHYGYSLENDYFKYSHLEVHHYGLFCNTFSLSEEELEKVDGKLKVNYNDLLDIINGTIYLVKKIFEDIDYSGYLRYRLAMQNMSNVYIINSPYRGLKVESGIKMIPLFYDKEIQYLNSVDFLNKATYKDNDIVKNYFRKIYQSFGLNHWDINHGGRLDIE